MTQNYDLLIIGTGPGGYISAIRAAQLGMSVAVVEKEPTLGGICLNWGCIPTKALLKTAELCNAITHAEEFGITVKGAQVDFNKVIARSREVSAKLAGGVEYLMKKNKITVIKGTASFASVNTMEIKSASKTETIEFTHAIIATGARARTIPNVLQADEKNIWTYKTAMTPKELPKSLLVIGAGAIGMEFANFYNALGTKVTVAEAQNRIVPVEDEEISELLQKASTKAGMEIITNAKVENLKSGKNNVSVSLNGKKQTFDKAILAIGITGNVEGLGLEKLSLPVEKGQILHNEFMQTRISNIYAIGDVAGAPWLAHVASHEGVVAVEHIASTKGLCKQPKPMNKNNLPGCTYTTPQVASTGLTEAQANAQGYKIKVGRFNYSANGKALAIGENEGLVKTIFNAKTGELLGAHIIGAEATEMITVFVLGKHMEAVEADFFHACLPHPTLSEMVGESVLDSLGLSLNS